MLGFFRRKADETRDVPLNGPYLAVAEIFGATPASSGMAVTPTTAMRCTPVRCAVQTIAESVGQLPVHVYRRKDDGSKERATDHPAYVLLHDQANDWTPSSALFEQVTRDALLRGNGYTFINRLEGQLRELVRLDPETIVVERDDRTGEPVYRLNGKAENRYLDRRDLIHIAAPSLDGVSGESPVRQCREAIGIALAMERHAAGLFGNGARPSGILSMKGRLTGDQAARLKASWQEYYAGTGNSGKTPLLEEDMSFQPITFNSVDAQFLEVWQHIITEIARVFRVPPHMLFEMGRATWGNAEEMGASFVQFTLMRWIKAWQGELRLKLFSAEERSDYFAEWLLDDLLRADIGKRADAYGKLISARVLNPNEVRAMENRAPYAGGEVFANPNTTTDTPSAPADDTGGAE